MNTQTSQTFFLCRDSTTEELKSITVTEVEKENMLAILKKLHEQHLEEQVVNSDADSAEDEDALSKQTLEQLQRKVFCQVSLEMFHQYSQAIWAGKNKLYFPCHLHTSYNCLQSN